MGQIPDSIIDEISRRSDILDIVGAHVLLTRKNDRWWGLCPFHNEKTPSFSVSPDTNLFYCFGCQKGGSVFQFVMEMDGLSFPETVEKLAEKAGIDLPHNDAARQGDRRRSLENLYGRVSTTFRWLLLHRPEAGHARKYLSERGINDETADFYKIGWAPSDGEWLYRFLLKKKYSPEFLSESGLFSSKSPQWAIFVDRVIFPVMPDEKRVVAFSGRALNDRAPKYINSPQTGIFTKREQLYGLGQARKSIRSSKNVVLCEGNMDVLSCQQAGVGETVAPLGTAFTLDQAKQIKKMVNRMTLCFDADNAGRAASMKAAIIAERIGLTVMAAILPSNSDPADILLENGATALKKILQRPINIFEYLLNSLLSAQSRQSGELRLGILENLAPYLEAVESEVRREAYLGELANTIRADPIAVIRDFKNRREREKPIALSRADFDMGAAAEIETVGDELFLMAAVAVKTEYFATLRKRLAPEMLRDRRALSVYRALDELSVDGKIPRSDAVISILEDESLKQFILEKAASGIYDDKAELTIFEKVKILKLRSLSNERQEIVNSLATTSGEDIELRKAKLKRIKEIDQVMIATRQGENDGNQV